MKQSWKNIFTLWIPLLSIHIVKLILLGTLNIMNAIDIKPMETL